MMALFPDNAELAALTKAAVAPMPDCVPLSLSLDGLLKHSAHHHHNAAEHEAEADEKRRREIAEAKEERVVPADPLEMTPEELNQASRLIPTCQLKGRRPQQSLQWHHLGPTVSSRPFLLSCLCVQIINAKPSAGCCVVSWALRTCRPRSGPRLRWPTAAAFFTLPCCSDSALRRIPLFSAVGYARKWD